MLRFALIVLLGALHSFAQTTSFPGMTGWESVGGNIADWAREGELHLPGGGQLSTMIQGRGITLRLVSKPSISSDPKEIPVLEIGATALAIIRENDALVLKVVDAENRTFSVPTQWLLRGDDEVSVPVAIEVTRRNMDLIISCQNQVWTYEVGSMGENTEIVLSAGETEPWVIIELSITTEPVLESSSVTQDGVAFRSSQSDNDTRSAIGRDQHDVSLIATEDSQKEAVGGSEQAVTSEKTNGSISLDVFTPPSVRRSRSALVRTVLIRAETEKKEHRK